MALSKSIATASGVTASYHKIDALNLVVTRDPSDDLQLSVRVARYYDEETRDENKAPLEYKSYKFTQSPIVAGAATDDLLTAIYTMIKTHADFTGAENC